MYTQYCVTRGLSIAGKQNEFVRDPSRLSQAADIHYRRADYDLLLLTPRARAVSQNNLIVVRLRRASFKPIPHVRTALVLRAAARRVVFIFMQMYLRTRVCVCVYIVRWCVCGGP